MVYESFPWKQDLYRRRNEIVEYNTADHFVEDDEKTYTILEKGIFYSAFIIRKLIDCGSKTSGEVDHYSIPIIMYKPLKEINRYSRWPDEKTYDWDHYERGQANGKDVCNWLIHSYVFFLCHDGENGPMTGFFVASDFDRNKVLYYIEIDDWLKYIDFVATDDIEESYEQYDEKKKDYVYLTKKRGND